jgi:hypothetical protein
MLNACKQRPHWRCQTARSLSDFGGSRRRSGRTVPIFRKFKANSRLLNENFRKSGAVIPLLRPIHPKSDRLLVCWQAGEKKMSEQPPVESVRYYPPGDGGPTIATTECGAAISNDRMERFLASFEASARRWEIIVYPALFAFVVLAAYGFFLVYSLTKDVSVLAESVERSMAQNLQTVATRMEDVSSNVASMSEKMERVSNEMEEISRNISSVPPIANNMVAMNRNVAVMAVATDQMRHDVGGMNRAFAPPMHFVRNFVPW